MYSKTSTIEINGMRSNIIDIEANIFKGMFAFSIVGIQRSKVKESREKIISCLKSLKIRLPNKKIIVNFSKNKSTINEDYYDLPILISLLKSLEVVKDKSDYLLIGHINLKGDLVPLENPYRIIKVALDNNVKKIVIPYDENIFKIDNEKIDIYYAKNISEVINFLNNNHRINHPFNSNCEISNSALTINDVIGQEALLRALIISVVGRHHILISGVSGSGKSISVEAINSIIPQSNMQENLYINSFNQNFENTFLCTPQIIKCMPNIKLRDFIGDASHIGLITKSSLSFLYMDEINIYSKAIIDNLRLPMENRMIAFNDNDDTIYANSDFTLIATMNPCPCGNLGSEVNKCICSMGQISRYQDRVNKPLEERFQIKINVDRVDMGKGDKKQHDIAFIKEKIKKAWILQKNRYNNVVGMYNGRLEKNEIEEFIGLDDSILILINDLISFYNLSMRIRSNIIVVARSIADYENSFDIKEEHVYEALNYQKLTY